MKKHKIFTSEIILEKCDLVCSDLKEEELLERLKYGLINNLVELMVKEGDLITLNSTKNTETGDSKFRMSLVVINESDYIKLENIIRKNNLFVYDEDHIVQILELL